MCEVASSVRPSATVYENFLCERVSLHCCDANCTDDDDKDVPYQADYSDKVVYHLCWAGDRDFLVFG